MSVKSLTIPTSETDGEARPVPDQIQFIKDNPLGCQDKYLSPRSVVPSALEPTKANNYQGMGA